MREGDYIQIWLNPLKFIDLKFLSLDNNSIDDESLLEFLCDPEIDSRKEDIINRYRKIDASEKQLFAPPAEKCLLQKIVWPLRHAKSSFMLGNFLGTISICGLVAEMVAILFYKISEFKINNKKMSFNYEKKIFGETYKELGQFRRIEILKAFNIIDKSTYEAFNKIRKMRNKYLHEWWLLNYEQTSDDAIETYISTLNLVIKLVGQDIKDKKICLNPNFLEYLKSIGFF